MKRTIDTLLLLLLMLSFAHAQSAYYAGALSLKNPSHGIAPQLEATVQLISPTGSPAADSIPVYWGDGSSGFLQLAASEAIENNETLHTYTGTHVFPAQAAYKVTVPPCCFSNEISNIADNTPIFLETEYAFLNPQFQGVNAETPVPLELTNGGAAGAPVQSNPNVFDVDNDSIAYRLLNPSELAAYTPPNEFDPGGAGTLTIDANTGDVNWDSPSLTGERYVLPMQIQEFRNGLSISTTAIWYGIEIGNLSALSPARPAGLQLFPNPTAGGLQIKIDAPEKWAATLFNTQGQPVRHWRAIPSGGQLQLPYPGGVYTLRLASGMRVWSEKVVIAR